MALYRSCSNWDYRDGPADVPRTEENSFPGAVTLIVAFYSILGIGAGFGIYGSSTDETGIWVAFLMVIAACSLVGCSVSAVLLVWINSRLLPEGSRPKPA